MPTAPEKKRGRKIKSIHTLAELKSPTYNLLATFAMAFKNSCKMLHAASWRGVRVVEGARLESVCRGNLTEGSNPSLSAS